GEPLVGIDRIERDVGSADRPDAEDGRKQPDAARQQDRHPVTWTDAVPTYGSGDPLRRGPDLRTGQFTVASLRDDALTGAGVPEQRQSGRPRLGRLAGVRPLLRDERQIG